MKRWKSNLIQFTMMAASLAMLAAPVKAESVSFLGQTYRLASFNQKASPMWEFVRPAETVDNWTSLLTIVERPDARSRVDLDRLSEGTLAAYRANGGRVLMAKTMAGASGVPYNYMVVAFDQPGQHRFELNFVKAVLGAKGAYMVIYGVRVTDARDYVAKSKAFLDEHSQEIGKSLENVVVPEPTVLPRKPF